MSDQVEKFLDEEWKHYGWEYRNDVPYCDCGHQLRGDKYPSRVLDEHRVQAALAAAGVTQPEPEYEYGFGWDYNGKAYGCRMGSREAAEDYVRQFPEVDGDPIFAVRRTPRIHEGEWEPVPNQTGETP